MLFDLLYWNFSFLRSGTGGLTAQAYGCLLAAPHTMGQRGEQKRTFLHHQLPSGTATDTKSAISVSPAAPRVDHVQAHHVDQVQGILRRALRIALVSGAALIALQWVVLWLAFLFVDCSPEVRELASEYFKIRIWAAPATLSLFAFKGWFIGLQDTVRPMIADLLVNGLNIALSFGLGFGLCGLPAMGFAGVAAGTLIAQWCGFAYAAIAARRALASLGAPRTLGQLRTQKAGNLCPDVPSGTATGTKTACFVSPAAPEVDQVQAQCATGTSEPHSVDQVQGTMLPATPETPNLVGGDGAHVIPSPDSVMPGPDRESPATAGDFFKMNRDLVLRSVGMIAVYIGFTVISARYGDTMLAVSAIIMKLLLVFSYFTDGFAYAGEALTGKYIGARDREGVQSAVRGAFIWGWGLAAAFMLLYGLGGVPAFRLLTSDVTVVDAGREFIPWLLLMPLIGVPAFIWDGIFTGATATSAMRNSTLLCAVGFFAVWFGGLGLVTALHGSAPEGPLAIHILMTAYFAHLAIRSIYLTVVRKKALPVEVK